MKHSSNLPMSRPNNTSRTSISSLAFSHTALSEAQVIELSDKFLTNGLHYIDVDSIEHGRTFISTFLNSLNYYHKVAVLSSEAVVPEGHINNYSLLAQDDLINKASYNFTEFLCNNFYHDFFWIEATPDLKDAMWFKYFEQDLLSLNFDRIMPIMVLSYR